MKSKLLSKAYTSLASFAVMLAVLTAVKPLCWLVWYEPDIPESLKK
ncbi:MAG: cyclic lactone autoinducer peptide [Syntrophomonadaceae bacterium]|jgi:cyclic lactone autoinducer peptide|nr:cyclic lactone autoinducer peptide [Syntrophomonadaceae bacterium]